MAFDGIVTKSISNELCNSIINCKVNKIYEPTKNDIIFNLYGNGKIFNLAICTNASFARLHLTEYTKPNPLNAPNFCMFLRKHLVGAIITDINSFDLERIVKINFETYNELNDKINKTLYIELMGQFSNVILVNENGTILDCLNHVSTKARELLPVRPYSFPVNTKQSFLELSNFEEFYKIFNDNFNSSIDKTLSDTFIGISRKFIQAICVKLDIDLLINNKENLRNLYNYIKKIIENIDKLNVECFLMPDKSDYYIDIAKNPSKLAVNTFLDKYYYEKEQQSLYSTYREYLLSFLLRTLNKYKKRLININSKLKECDKMDTYKLYGELLTSNLYMIKEPIDSITVLNYYTGKDITIPLDSTLSPSKNVERYYKKFNKCKNTIEVVNKQKVETEEELKYMEGLIFSIQECNSLIELQEIGNEVEENFSISMKNNVTKNDRKKEQKSMPKKYEINGFTVYVGRNNKQNDALTKSANKEDMWFHTQQIHGSHVILKTEGKQVDFDTILKCASLAATNSKAKNSNNVPVDYTYVKYVRKPAGSKPGMAVYVNYKTVYVN